MRMRAWITIGVALAAFLGWIGYLFAPLALHPVSYVPPEHRYTATATSTAPLAADHLAPGIPVKRPLPPSAIGLVPIEAAQGIGSIANVFYHAGTRALFMAVYENDHTRSIWRMDPDGKVERVLKGDAGPGDVRILGDSRGHLFAEFENPALIYRSDDEGRNWQLVLAPDGIFWAIADDGQGTLWATIHADNTAILYRSTDDGVIWKPWKDFQKMFPEYAVQYAPPDRHFKLRHLHDVLYDGGRLFVGTGDVARFTFMTTDGGTYWTKIWDEGFTAGTAMSDTGRILLGPDQLQSHGIAMYDFSATSARQVWSPIPYDWAGYCYKILDVRGFYYAAFHTENNEVPGFQPKYGIIVSPDGEHWYPFLTLGPLTSVAATSIDLADGDGAVYVVIDGTLYATKPIDSFWFGTHHPFGAP